VELPTTEPIVSVAPGSPMMAMTESGTLYLWGDIWPNDDPDDAIENPFPIRFDLPAPAAVVGEIAQCMLATDSSVYCFRNNEAGKLGFDDPNLFTLEPTPIDLDGVVHLSESSDHACAVLANGQVWCWGSNSFGAMGQPWPDVTWHPQPIRVPGLPPLSKVFATLFGTCGVEPDGKAWCWTRDNTFGPPALPPIPWRHDLRFTDLGLGESFVCGLVDDGRVLCDGLAQGWCLEGTCFMDVLSALDQEPSP
jgi:hypothetical protein